MPARTERAPSVWPVAAASGLRLDKTPGYGWFFREETGCRRIARR
jgi:hypothetical protein